MAAFNILDTLLFLSVFSLFLQMASCKPFISHDRDFENGQFARQTELPPQNLCLPYQHSKGGGVFQRNVLDRGEAFAILKESLLPLSCPSALQRSVQDLGEEFAIGRNAAC